MFVAFVQLPLHRINKFKDKHGRISAINYTIISLFKLDFKDLFTKTIPIFIRFYSPWIHILNINVSVAPGNSSKDKHKMPVPTTLYRICHVIYYFFLTTSDTTNLFVIYSLVEKCQWTFNRFLHHMYCTNARCIVLIKTNAHFNLLIYSHLLSPITFHHLKWLNLIEFNWQSDQFLSRALFSVHHSCSNICGIYEYTDIFMLTEWFDLNIGMRFTFFNHVFHSINTSCSKFSLFFALRNDLRVYNCSQNSDG